MRHAYIYIYIYIILASNSSDFASWLFLWLPKVVSHLKAKIWGRGEHQKKYGSTAILKRGVSDVEIKSTKSRGDRFVLNYCFIRYFCLGKFSFILNSLIFLTHLVQFKKKLSKKQENRLKRIFLSTHFSDCLFMCFRSKQYFL